jgi:hypothetical protein
LAAGLEAALTGRLHPLPPPTTLPAASVVPLFVIVRAYASGTTALTGVEAISNGVSIFRPVEWRNARRVLTWMGAILAVSFTGITLLAWKLHPFPSERKTVVAQLGDVVFGPTPVGRLGLLLLQVATTAILVLAATTAFNDFPRLASFHAADGFLPRPLRRRGSRLVPSVGIVALAVVATTVVVVLGANVHRMIPLYAVGVFTSFTFSQAGMMRHHLRHREEHWRRGLILNGLGALGSGLALLAVLVTKFTHGAWIIVLLVPAGVLLSLAIHRHYQRADAWLAAPDSGRADWRRTRAVVALSRPDRALEAAARRYVDHLRPEAGIEVEVLSRRGRIRPALRRIRERAPAGCLTVIVVPLRAGQGLPPPWSPVSALLRRAGRLDDVAVVGVVVDPDERPAGGRHACLVAVGGADALARRGLAVARLLHPDEVHAVHVEVDPDEAARAVATWESSGLAVELRILPAPYRERGGPLREEVQRLRRTGAEVVSVVICTLRLRWWQRPLYLADTGTIRRALAAVTGAALVEHRLPYNPDKEGSHDRTRRLRHHQREDEPDPEGDRGGLRLAERPAAAVVPRPEGGAGGLARPPDGGGGR